MRFINQFQGTEIGAPGAGNTIAFNAGNGINLATTAQASTGNRIRGNAIFSNGGLGIDLGGNGVTANDNCDSDNGVNRTQNYPILTSANASGGNLTLAGTLNSAANTAFTVDFYISPACDASGNGEGQTYLGSATVTTNAS